MEKKSRLDIQKSVLRKRMREVLSRMSPPLRKKKSLKIFSQVCRSKYFQKASCVMVYASLPKEVATYAVIREALKLKKIVCLPCAALKNGSMSARRIKSLRDLQRAAFGILEPDIRKTKMQSLAEIDLVLVPGLGFDRKGRRLGRGKGCYDRFLRKMKGARLIGLAFREQMVRKIPVGAHDIKMHQVITA